MLHSIIGGNNYITINKSLIKKLGIIEACVLTEVIHIEGKTPEIEWIPYNSKELSENLELQLPLIETAIDHLEQAEIVEKSNINGVVHYKTNEKKIFELLK